MDVSGLTRPIRSRWRMGGDVRQANQAEKEEVAQARPATMLGRDGGFGSLYGHGWAKVALAQKPPAARQVAASRSEALPVRRYDIPGGHARNGSRPVPEDFGRIGQRARYITPEHPSPGVNGTFTSEQALQQLLTGTGLTYSFTDAHQFTIELKPVVSTLEVTETAPIISSSMPKYQQPLLDTPRTVDVVSQATMEQQGATTLRDSLRNVAGISLAAGEGGSQGDNLIRGFTARNDLYIDGMRDFGSYYRDPFNTEEVEVLQGPSSVTLGRGSTGGVVNQATKTANLNQFLAVDLAAGTDATRRAVLDWNVPVPKLGSGAAFRLNAMGDIGGRCRSGRGEKPTRRRRSYARSGPGHSNPPNLQLFSPKCRRHPRLRHSVAI